MDIFSCAAEQEIREGMGEDAWTRTQSHPVCTKYSGTWNDWVFTWKRRCTIVRCSGRNRRLIWYSSMIGEYCMSRIGKMTGFTFGMCDNISRRKHTLMISFFCLRSPTWADLSVPSRDFCNHVMHLDSSSKPILIPVFFIPIWLKASVTRPCHFLYYARKEYLIGMMP